MRLRNEFHCHIGYANNPNPPDTSREDRIDNAISNRVEEIWRTPDLLAIATDELGYPFKLPAIVALSEFISRTLLNAHPKTDAERFALAVANEIAAYVEEQAKDFIHEQMED